MYFSVVGRINQPTYTLVIFLLCVITLVSCQKSNVGNQLNTDVEELNITHVDPSQFSPVFSDSGNSVVVTEAQHAVQTFELGTSLDELILENPNLSIFTESLSTLSTATDGSTVERILSNSDGYVVLYSHDTTDVVAPYKIWRHNQEDDVRTLVYAGTRTVESVAISLDGNTVIAVMDRSTSDSNKDVTSFDITAGSSTQLTTTDFDESNVSISGDGAVIVWQGLNSTTNSQTIFYRQTSSATTTMLQKSYDMLEPSVTQNGKLIAFKYINAGSNYSDGKDRYISFSYNIEQRKLHLLFSLSLAFSNPSMNDDGSQLLIAVVQSEGSSNYSIKRFDLIERSWKALRVQDTLAHTHLTADGLFAVYGRKNATGPIYTDVRDIAQNTSALTDMKADAMAHFWQKPSTLTYDATYSGVPVAGNSINLGSSVLATTSDPQTITVNNTGTSILKFSSRISGMHASDFAVTPTSSQQLINGSVSINITCTPSALGIRTAKLVVFTNDLNQLRLEYPLGCTGIGATVFVDKDAIGNNDGSSWTDAYTTLQDALSNVVAGQQVWVAAETYYPDEASAGQVEPQSAEQIVIPCPLACPFATDRSATFQLINGVEIYGGFDGVGAGGIGGTLESQLSQRDIINNLTTLSGELLEDDDPTNNSYHVVTGSGTDSTAILDGFTITRGEADGLGNLGRGGGLFNDQGSPTLRNLVFFENAAVEGAAVANVNASSPSFSDVFIDLNYAFVDGGGMANFSASNPTLNEVVFRNNLADNDGGGMFNLNSTPILDRVSFIGNITFDDGAGLYNEASSPSITNTLFAGNSAVDSGGALYNYDNSNPVVTNTTFSTNYADDEGGAIRNTLNSDPIIQNSIFYNNSAFTSGNSIANFDATDTPTVSYSLFDDVSLPTGSTDGNNNIFGADPDFFMDVSCGADLFLGSCGDDPTTFPLDESADDFYGVLLLNDFSPAIDAANNDVNSTTKDLATTTRKVNDTGVNDTGNGTAPIIDMGAFEKQTNSVVFP